MVARTPQPLDLAVGARIKLARKERGMSQAALAQALGITFQQVQKYENGTNRVSAARLYEIAGVLQVSAADLLGEGTSLDRNEALSGIDTDELARLVTAFRGLPDVTRKDLLRLIEGLAVYAA